MWRLDNFRPRPGFCCRSDDYAEIMTQHAWYLMHLPAGFPSVGRYSDMLTVRVEQRLAHQTWRLALVTFYGLTNADYLVQPQAAYAISDRLSITVGANALGGRRGWTPFGRLGENDNVYASVRFDF